MCALHIKLCGYDTIRLEEFNVDLKAEYTA